MNDEQVEDGKASEENTEEVIAQPENTSLVQEDRKYLFTQAHFNLVMEFINTSSIKGESAEVVVDLKRRLFKVAQIVSQIPE